MKNLLCISVAFLSCVSVAMGQWQQEKSNLLSEKIEPEIINANFKNSPLDPYLLNSRELIWNWDTIITYDTVGLYERYIQTFDPNGNTLTRTTQIWQNNDWENDTRKTNTYDANGNILTTLNEVWESGSWDNYTRGTFTYDPNGNMLTDLYEQWFYGWEKDEKGTYAYDSNGNWLSYVREIWQLDTWVNSMRFTLTYDGNGNQTTFLYEWWENSVWINMFKSTYSWDANGNMLTQLRETWQTNTWENDWKRTWTYDSNGNMLSCVREHWQSSAWVNVLKYTYMYDANGNSVTGKFEMWQSGNWEPEMEILDLYSQQQELFHLWAHLYEASFVSFNTGIESTYQQARSLKVFPNPAGESITIELTGQDPNAINTICIYGMDGREVIRQERIGLRMEIDVASLPGGLYGIRVRNSRGNRFGKFIKK